jgi:hypothetical protein
MCRPVVALGRGRTTVQAKVRSGRQFPISAIWATQGYFSQLFPIAFGDVEFFALAPCYPRCYPERIFEQIVSPFFFAKY